MKPVFANELERTLAGDSFAAPPLHILEGVDDALAHRDFPGVPRSIYAELWHIVFWQQISLDWVRGIPSVEAVAAEPWSELRTRFSTTLAEVTSIARDADRLEQPVECPSPPGHPTRTMAVREQLESLTAHNAYHFGRIVLMRQMAGAWPPPSGGFTW
jgi:uncharacterized damage-inducible protein DinB